MSIRVLFLTFHNVHRSLNVMKTRPLQNFDGFVYVNSILANSSLTGSLFHELLGKKDYSELGDYFSLIADVLKELKGAVYTYTYWDYAKDPTDLISLFEDTLDVSYTMDLKNKNLYAKMNYETETSGINKLITCFDFFAEWKKLQPIKENFSNLEEIISKRTPIKNSILPHEDLAPLDLYHLYRISVYNIKMFAIQNDRFGLLRCLGYIFGTIPIMKGNKEFSRKYLENANSEDASRIREFIYDLVKDPQYGSKFDQKRINDRQYITSLIPEILKNSEYLSKFTKDFAKNYANYILNTLVQYLNGNYQRFLSMFDVVYERNAPLTGRGKLAKVKNIFGLSNGLEKLMRLSALANRYRTISFEMLTINGYLATYEEIYANLQSLNVVPQSESPIIERNPTGKINSTTKRNPKGYSQI